MRLLLCCRKLIESLVQFRIPIYALATIVSLSSRVLSHTIDTVRDIYEVCMLKYIREIYSMSSTSQAFVVYSFFILLVNYLEGERGVLSILQDRIRIHHLWPFNLFLDPMDVWHHLLFRVHVALNYMYLADERS